jgi:hypothetical protein
VLYACVYWHHDPRWRYLIGAAVSAGLALLSKSPSLVLLPVVCAMAVGSRRQTPTGAGSVRRVALPILVGSLICGAVVVGLWPALWVAPIQSFEALRFGVVNEGAQPHMLGNFFLGRQDDAPGVLFYPVATVLRLTPWTLLGLLVLPWAWRSARSAERQDLATLAGFAVLFIVALSPFPKKFNRYLVPIFPALDMLAAYSLVWGAEQLAKLGRRNALRAAWGPRAAPLLLSAVVVGALANVVWWHPYEIAAFNQALGGAAVGARTFTVGWGEGLEQVAAWLNQQPDITGVQTASTQVPSLQPYLRRSAQALTPRGALPEQTGYVVIYVRDAQSGPPGPPFDRFYGQRPIHTVRIAGVEYAWIYQVPPRVAHVRPARFGSTLLLRGYTDSTAQLGKTLHLQLFWKVLAHPTTDYTLFAHLLGADGRRYAQADLPHPTGKWDADRYLTTELMIPLPAALPAGKYEVVIGWYDQTMGRRLPLEAPTRLRSASDGLDGLVLMQVSLNQTHDE